MKLVFKFEQSQSLLKNVNNLQWTKEVLTEIGPENNPLHKHKFCKNRVCYKVTYPDKCCSLYKSDLIGCQHYLHDSDLQIMKKWISLYPVIKRMRNWQQPHQCSRKSKVQFHCKIERWRTRYSPVWGQFNLSAFSIELPVMLLLQCSECWQCHLWSVSPKINQTLQDVLFLMFYILIKEEETIALPKYSVHWTQSFITCF